jgi:hypothetical protein
MMYSSANIIKMVESKWMRRALYVTRIPMNGKKNTYRIVSGKHIGRDHLQDLGVDRIVILKCLMKWNVRM